MSTFQNHHVKFLNICVNYTVLRPLLCIIIQKLFQKRIFCESLRQQKECILLHNARRTKDWNAFWKMLHKQDETVHNPRLRTFRTQCLRAAANLLLMLSYKADFVSFIGNREMKQEKSVRQRRWKGELTQTRLSDPGELAFEKRKPEAHYNKPSDKKYIGHVVSPDSNWRKEPNRF